ncbi:alkene reductase [Nonlabens tegetincola]|uniref:alkene reductase n=1 Tax=Nonlabens tegetincola TaxID=323273 RepID=UPI0030C7FD3F
MSSSDILYSKITSAQDFKNRIVMAPMTRSRATEDHIPTPIMAAYYGERASAGLLITEGTSPSPNGVGYARIPGIYNDQQIDAWRAVTKAVHANGGKIFLQIMHTGRVSHPDNMPNDAKIVAPSAIAPENTKMWVDGKGELEIPVPNEMSSSDIEQVIEEFVQAAQNAIAADFDGVEIHGANGYLLEQFFNPASNKREDEYGGSVENRSKVILEIAKRTVAAIGADRVGVRLSPNGAMNDVGPWESQKQDFEYLVSQFNSLNLLYLHLLDHQAMGANPLPEDIRTSLQSKFDGINILCGGYDKSTAIKDLTNEKADMIAFGRPFVANPDLVERFKQDADLNEVDQDTLYTPGKEGYLDYPKMEPIS